MTQVAAGLGLLPGCVIDQHFEQRNRYGRLLMIVSQSPQLLGIGVDEDTGAVIRHDTGRPVLVVGDSLAADVGVAEAMGWDSLLLLTGSTRESDLKPSGAPTFVQTDLVAVLRDMQG